MEVAINSLHITGDAKTQIIARRGGAVTIRQAQLGDMAMPPARSAHHPDRSAADTEWIALQRAGGQQRRAVAVVHPFRHVAAEIEYPQRVGFEEIGRAQV